MGKKIFILSIFLANVYFGFAETRHIRLVRDTGNNYKKLYIVEFDDRPPIITRYLVLDPQRIANISSMSNESNAELCKLLKIDFVMVIKFQPNTKLLTLNDVLELYKIEITDWNLPLVIDDKKIDYPQTLLIARNQIEKITVMKGAGGAFIQITTI
jgi:hypothetical protein